MKQETIKTIAALFSQHYGETTTPEQVAAKMFNIDKMQAICTDWFKNNTSFKTRQYISPELCREVQKLASREYIAVALEGKARKIVALDFPCMVVWCESSDTGITDPYCHDLPEYARIDRQTGAIKWERHAGLLSNEQRKRIILAASAYNPNAVCC